LLLLFLFLWGFYRRRRGKLQGKERNSENIVEYNLSIRREIYIF